MKKDSFITQNEEETIDLAEDISREALEISGADDPLIFYLEGELGSGKTHFVKGIARAFGIREKITSPTFVLVKKMEIPRTDITRRKNKALFFHVDCYRIYDSEDAQMIGLNEILKNPRSVVAIEWAERIKDIIPRPYWKIRFRHIGEEMREIGIKYQQ